MLSSNSNDLVEKKAEFMNQLSSDPDIFETESAEDILSLSLKTFAPKIALASSFGAEDVVVIDLMYNAVGDKTRVFTLDTGRLNPETYDVMDKIRKKYSISIETIFPDYLEVEKMVTENGVNLMYDSVEKRKLCCRVRKVNPLGRMLKTLDAWITGLRRDQTSTRSAIKKVELDASNNNIIKINPIADWTNDMVWDYVKKNNIPYNKLHDKGYPSIGCAPCTRAVKPGEDLRAGRWWWENDFHKECGLHWNK
ncbi:Thioredoxin-dependent 5'-adenylylsulfate reductase [Candidatus Nitrosocosmicus franklandus]|uniref:Adenosine 5'-phosphosulfate reductase n=2 Tax=Candidatus Nitrosocosmicus franklandianus TaxID=1798806 RepID=A0A484IA21_9ARCH|nr:phosphoadenylyl-sulfate reductase [Candidatus Nitrosocosmicus franklandus]VFJ14093.1 Thioredoxin-dependent 5'-adenylylsulfate reductase [Candidatus Nitrosocosmicus franklandus]